MTPLVTHGYVSVVLDMRLLGSPVLTADGEPLRVDTGKAIAVLAYLAVEGTTARDTLAGLLWPESSQDRARATLRRTLSAVRAGAGVDVILADREAVSLHPDTTSDLALVAAELSALESHGHGRGEVCPRCVPPLRRVAQLHRGDFLHGFSVRDSPEFEDWVRVTAERLRMQAGTALQLLAMALAGEGDYGAAVEAGERWIGLDPLHEPANRFLMLLHAWGGNRPSAIAAYHRFASVLDTELGVPPLEETRELMEAILDEDLPPPPGAPRQPRPALSPAPEPAPLLGRTWAVDQLELIATSSEENRLVVVSGGPWMGKTRVLEEIERRITSSKGQVLSSRAFRGDQMIPYALATRLLRRAHPSVDPPDWATTELSRLMPELASPEKLDATDPYGELRLFEAIHTLLVSPGAGPVVVLVDDLQWVDTASARALSYVLERPSDRSVVLVATHRLGDMTGSAAADLIAGADTTIRLEPLTAADIVDELEEDEASAVIEATGGIPLLVAQAVTGAEAHAGITDLTQYLQIQLSEIGELDRQILTSASVLGGVADLELLGATSGRTDDEVVLSVERLVASGILKDHPDGVLFSLPIVERAVYDGASALRRLLLHRRAGQALTQRRSARSDARQAATAAMHLEKAGATEAADWYHIAGDLARASFAHEEAVVFYESALALGGGEEATLRLRLGELALIRGDYETATRHLISARARATDEVLGLIEHRLGQVYRLLGRFEMASDHYARALTHHPSPADLYSDWALLRSRTGERPEAMQLARRALEAADAGGDHRQMSRARTILALFGEDPESAHRLVEEAILLASEDEGARMSALNTLAQVLSDRGDLEGAIEAAKEAIDLAVRSGHRHREAALRNRLSDLLHEAGRDQDAMAALAGSVTLFASMDPRLSEPEIWLLSSF